MRVPRSLMDALDAFYPFEFDPPNQSYNIKFVPVPSSHHRPSVQEGSIQSLSEWVVGWVLKLRRVQYSIAWRTPTLGHLARCRAARASGARG